MVDGDHSGGGNTEQDGKQAQVFSIYAETRDFLDNDMLLLYHDECEWCARPPYAEAGSGILGENPVFWVIEFYATPFDLLIWDEPEASMVSTLEPGKVIGLSINVTDSDTDGKEWDLHQFTPGSLTADTFADGLLVGKQGVAGDDSVVETVSWARIKASLNY